VQVSLANRSAEAATAAAAGEVLAYSPHGRGTISCGIRAMREAVSVQPRAKCGRQCKLCCILAGTWLGQASSTAVACAPAGAAGCVAADISGKAIPGAWGAPWTFCSSIELLSMRVSKLWALGSVCCNHPTAAAGSDPLEARHSQQWLIIKPLVVFNVY
jgi:hypothetical protein